MTKIVLLFAGFALAGPGAHAEFKVPKNLSHAIHYVLPEYKETFISFDLDKNLAKQISLVIESGTLRDGVKTHALQGKIIKATPLQNIWSDNAVQKQQRLQVLTLTLNAMVNFQAKALAQSIAPAAGVVSQNSELIQVLTKALGEGADLKELAVQLKKQQDEAQAIVEQVENYRSLIKDNVEEGLAAGGMSQEDIDTLKRTMETSNLKLTDFVPGAFGMHIGFKLTESVLALLQKLPGIAGRIAAASDGSATFTVLAQPWEVEVISRSTNSDGVTIAVAEKYLYIQGNPHLWVNGNKVKSATHPATERGLIGRWGFTFISGNVEDFQKFFGGFIGVSFDIKGNKNVKLGSLLTNGDQMLGNHFLMISPSHKWSATQSTATVSNTASSNSSGTWIEKIKSRGKNAVASTKPRMTSGIVFPPTEQAIRSLGSSLFQLFKDEALDALRSGELQK